MRAYRADARGRTHEVEYGEGSDDGYLIGVYEHFGSSRGNVAIVSYKSLPVIADGGCSVLTIRYSLREHRIESVRCNGYA
jgi:hypothetical protein